MRCKAQVNKNEIHKNIIIVDYKYKVDDRVILNNKAAYKCETPYLYFFLTGFYAPLLYS